MPIDYRVDATHGVLFVEAHGHVGDEELVAFARKTAADPQVRSGLNELIDLRDGDPEFVSSQAVQDVAAIFGAHDGSPTGAKLAIVASGDAVYGLSRMYQAYRRDPPGELRLFRDMREARAWLELPETE